MSAIRYSPLEPGDPRSAAGVNVVWDAIEVASAALSPENFAEEGLDHRAFEVHPVGKRTGKISETGRNAASLPVVGVYTQFVHNGTVYRLTSPGQIPASLAAGEMLRVRSRVWFETTLAAGQGLTGTGFGMRLVDSATGGEINYSQRDDAVGAGFWNHGTVFCEGWIVGPVAALAWVEAQYLLAAGGTAYPSRGMIWATLFRRQNLM